MTDGLPEALVRAVLTLFDEAYAGPPDPASTWFSDNAPDAAIFGTLAHLTAEQASAPQPGDTTIAAHAEHLRWSLALANAYFRGEWPKADWEESWRVRTVDGAAWDALRADLRREYEAARAAIDSGGVAALTANPEFLTGTLALIPHAAYHLGAIRRMVVTVA